MNVFMYIISIVATVGIGIVVFFLKRLVKDYDKRISTLEVGMNDMKVNYTDKFLKAERERNSMEKNIIASINNVTSAQKKAMSDFVLSNERSHNKIISSLKGEINKRG